jgi:hypothetical protein
MKLPKRMSPIAGSRRKLEKETTTRTYAHGGMCETPMLQGHDDLNGSHGGDTHWPMLGEKPMPKAKGGLMSKVTAKMTHRACGGMADKVKSKMPPRLERAMGGAVPKVGSHRMMDKASEAKSAMGGRKMHTMSTAVERAAGGHIGHEDLRGSKGGATSYPMRGMKPSRAAGKGATAKLAIGGVGKIRHKEATASGKPMSVPKRQPRGV